MGALAGGLLIFGISILSFGLYWMLLDEILVRYFTPFMRISPSFYMTDLTWHSLPWIFIIMGVLCLIGYGASRTSKGRVVEQ